MNKPTLLYCTIGISVLLFIWLKYNLDLSLSRGRELSAYIPREPKRGYFIYVCDGTFFCGGWADRFKGIVASYLIANATNRKFGIHMTVPCSLSNLFLPNVVDWQVNPSELPKESQVFMAMSDLDFVKSTAEVDLDKMFSKEVTFFAHNLDIVPYLKQNKLYHQNLNWMLGMETHQVYKHVYQTLFKFSPKLEDRLQEFYSKQQFGSSLKCAQIRLGQNPSNPEDTEVRGQYKDVALVWKFFSDLFSSNHDSSHNHHHHDHQHGHSHHHGNKGDNFNIFVTSDSEQVRADVARLFSDHVLDLQGELVHIERSTKNQEALCEGFEKVVLDQIILASCETLIISKSGFGELAAYFRGKDENLYCFRYSKLYKCSMSNFDIDTLFIRWIIIIFFINILISYILCLSIKKNSRLNSILKSFYR